MSWTDQRRKQVTDWYIEGVSAAQIAKRITEQAASSDHYSPTRNAVIAIISRMGLSSGSSDYRKKPSKPVVKTISRAPSPVYSPKAIPKAPKPPVPIVEAVSDAVPVPFESLKRACCKWPIGDPRSDGFGFCGAPTGDFMVRYCAHHRQIGANTKQPTTRSTESLKFFDGQTTRRAPGRARAGLDAW